MNTLIKPCLSSPYFFLQELIIDVTVLAVYLDLPFTIEWKSVV